MSYQYDIFISYRRDSETLSWITDHFSPLLVTYVGMALGRNPSIFLDESGLEAGTSWPNTLGTALGKSRVLIALWSGNYLDSAWCALEFSHMLARQSDAKLTTTKRPYGIVIPAFIHDGATFPSTLKNIQRFEIQQYFNVRMARNSTLAEKLASVLAVQAPAIANCIKYAPSWRKEWPEKAATVFFNRLHRKKKAVQRTVPRFTAQ